MDYKIFISYSGSSYYNFTVRHIRNALEDNGAEVFLDSLSIASGETVEPEIVKNLSDCDELWVLVSTSVQTMNLRNDNCELIAGTLTRPYVLMEIGAAWSRNIPIRPLLANSSPKEFQKDTDIPLLLRSKKCIEINKIDQYERLLEETKDRIERVKNFKKRGDRHKIKLPISIRPSKAEMLKIKKTFITEISSDGRGCFISVAKGRMSQLEIDQRVDIRCDFKARIKHKSDHNPSKDNRQGIGVLIDHD